MLTQVDPLDRCYSLNLPKPNIWESGAHLFLRHCERLFEALINALRIWIIVHVIMIFQIDFQLTFDDKWKPMLEEARYFSTMLSMSITDREEMAVPQP